MMDYPRCATCKWWRRFAKDSPDDDEPVVDHYGWCDNFRLGLNDHRRELSERSPLVYPVTNRTDVATRGDFGCVLWEAKE